MQRDNRATGTPLAARNIADTWYGVCLLLTSFLRMHGKRAEAMTGMRSLQNRQQHLLQ